MGAQQVASPFDAAYDLAAYGEEMHLTLPSSADLTKLTEQRDDASISIYLPSSPMPNDSEAVKLALRNATAEVQSQLETIGVGAADRSTIAAALEELQQDYEFWKHQGHSLAVFVSPQEFTTYRLANAIGELVAVGDRFDLGPLLRALTFDNGGFVLTLTEGPIRLYRISADEAPLEIDLPDLPEDLRTVLEHTTTGGRFDRHRASGATGQRVEQHRYCSLVQDAVLKRIGDSKDPLILAASSNLAPAYRAINTYDTLLEHGIDVNPSALTPADIDARARELFDAYYATGLEQWRERFGTLRGEGLATSQLAEVGRAIATAAVEDLHFDIGWAEEGTIDEFGNVDTVDEPGPLTYRIVDEMAARVLRSGGIVRAVRADDLPDDSPVAATLRFPLG